METGGAEESAAGARKREGGHSGRLLLRMPESLHADLAQASQRAGVSLNAYIIDALTTTLRGGTGAGKPKSASPPAPAAPEQGRPLLQRLLLVNLVVVAAVGVLVVVLLVQALR
jgi:RNA polymerase sigma-B factor